MFWDKSESHNMKTSYDSYNFELLNILNINSFNGVKLEFNKNNFLSRNLNLKSIINNNDKQYFVTYFKNNNLFQFSMEFNGNYQLKYHFNIKNFFNKYETIISKNKEVFTQFESFYHHKFYNLAFKLIKPAFETSNLVYIFNYWKSFKFLSIGFEVVSLNNYLGLGFSTRFDNNDDFVACLNVNRFNNFTLSFYKKMFRKLELGAEI